MNGQCGDLLHIKATWLPVLLPVLPLQPVVLPEHLENRNDSGQVTSAGKLQPQVTSAIVHPQVISAIEAFRASAQGF